MHENAQEVPLYCKGLRPVFHLLSLLVKICAWILGLGFVFFLFCAVYSVIWVIYIETYGDSYAAKRLDETARVLVKDHVGIEKFKMERVWVSTPAFDGAAGNWRTLLDDPFQLSKSSLKDYEILQKNDVIVIKEEGTRIGGFFATDQTGYTCYFRKGVFTGSETVCFEGSVRTCSVSLCVKEGERLVYVEVVQFP
ncbi:MAG: hypothetical protein IPH06_02175 [Alphaproteobacteria bacterium]|nr:hypothetical protein [Alphaproteobacteria bacterium]QQS56858.1 MAG: hypothetical protein IPN28_11430 [Alphaproteobacteria bacterium]